MARHLCTLGLCLGLLSALVGCGGGGGSVESPDTRVGLPASAASINDSNVVLIEVRRGSLGNINIPYVSVTVCIPGTAPNNSNCRTIDNVLLDTGSTGLRLFSAALTGLALPPQTVGGVGQVFECAQFVSSLALGEVQLADVRMGGEVAASVPIQVMDSGYTLATGSSCGSASVLATTTNSGANQKGLGANGILGVGHFINDGQRYFSCSSFDSTPGTGCALVVTAAAQVQNPVSSFASVNRNGVVVQLPPLPPWGAESALGFLIFGVETRSNNRLGTANLIPMNISGYFFTTTYMNHAYVGSIFDTGSNGVFFDDASIATCSSPYSDFYCPPSTLTATATVPDVNAAPVALGVVVANATALFTSTLSNRSYAYNNVSAPINNPVQVGNLSPYFIWGLPAYFGRSVYTLIEGRTAQPAAQVLTGPLSAFTNL